MRLMPLLLFLCITLSAPGCAVYDGVAYFHGSGEIIDLKIDKHLKSRMSYVAGSGKDGLVCSGALRTVHASGLSNWSCKGEDGKFAIACNDGRHLTGVWNAENCSSGQGLGGDQYGNTLVLAYATAREEALRKTGAGPGAKPAAFAGAAAVAPLYTALLGYEGEGGVALYSPREAAPDARARRGVAGFFSSPDGQIAAPASVLRGAAALSVYLPDEGRELPARIISVDPEKDIALLKIGAGGKVGGVVRVYARQN